MSRVAKSIQDVVVLWLRELVMAPSWFGFRGFVLALTKALVAPLLPGVRRYRKPAKEA